MVTSWPTGLPQITLPSPACLRCEKDQIQRQTGQCRREWPSEDSAKAGFCTLAFGNLSVGAEQREGPGPVQLSLPQRGLASPLCPQPSPLPLLCRCALCPPILCLESPPHLPQLHTETPRLQRKQTGVHSRNRPRHNQGRPMQTSPRDVLLSPHFVDEGPVAE